MQRVTSKMRIRVLQFNLVGVEIRELRPEVIAEGNEVLVHYRSRTKVMMVILDRKSVV